MKFKGAIAFSSFFILALLAILIFQIFDVSIADKISYESVMNVSRSETALKNNTSYTAKHLKEGTTKTLLLSQDETRKIGKLISNSSILYFSKENQDSELIEEMSGIRLIYQEEFKESDQIVLMLEAEQATYFYNQEKLVATHVQISRYRLPSHHFPTEFSHKTPFFKGTAEKILISFGKNTPTMQLIQFKASAI